MRNSIWGMEFETLIIVQVEVWSRQWTLEMGLESSRWEKHFLAFLISLFAGYRVRHWYPP